MYELRDDPEPRPLLRLVRDEDPPTYDAGQQSKPRVNGFVMFPWDLYDRLEGDDDGQLVLLALMRHANKDGECWPSVATIAKRTGRSDRQVRYVVKRLVENGLLTKESRVINGVSGTNVYRITANVQGCTPCSTPLHDMQHPPAHHAPPPAHGADRSRTSELEPDELDTPRTLTSTYPQDFEEFWALYPKGHGSKKASAAQWKRMSRDDRAAAAKAIPLFKAGRLWKDGYIKACERWLRDRLWENPPPAAPLTQDEMAYLAFTNRLVTQ